MLVALSFLILLLGYGESYPKVSHENAGTVCSNSWRNCLSSSFSIFRPNEFLQYTYEAKTYTSVHGVTSDMSGVFIKATVTLESDTRCTANMKLKDFEMMELSDELNKLQEIPRSQIDQIRNYLKQFSTNIVYENGTVKYICENKNEPSFASDIKKGILSMLQVNIDSTPKRMDDVSGSCVVSSTSANRIRFIQSKDLNGCLHRSNEISAFHGVPYNSNNSSYQNLPITEAENECQIEFSSILPESSHTFDGFIQNAVCREKHLLRPMSNNEQGLLTIIEQRLIATDIGKSEKVKIDFADPAYVQTSMFQANTFSLTGLQSTDIYSLANKFGLLCTDDVGLNAPKIFHDIVSQVRLLTVPEMRMFIRQTDSIYGSSGSANQNYKASLYDVLAMTNTEASITILSESMHSDKFSESDRIIWFTSLGFLQQTPTPNMLTSLLLLMNDVILHSATTESDMIGWKKQAMFGISSVVRQYCIKFGLEQCRSILPLQRTITLLKQYGCNNDVVLKTIGNIGFDVEKLGSHLSVCSKNRKFSMHNRISALKAMQKLNFDEDQQEGQTESLTELFADAREDAEVRIQAFLGLMAINSKHTLNWVKQVLENEQVNQVSSFVWTYLLNIQESNDPQRKALKQLISLPELEKRYSLDVLKYSRNIEKSFYSSRNNVGAKLESNLIWSQANFLPRSASINFTVLLFGKAYNLLDVDTRMEGLDEVLQAYLTNKNNMSMSYMSLLNSIKGSVDLSVLGKQISYWKFNGMSEVGLQQLTTLETLHKLITEGIHMDMDKKLILSEQQYVLSTQIGLPLKINLNISGVVKMNNKLSVERPSLTGEKQLVIRSQMKPQTAIHIGMYMGIDCPLGSHGIQVNADAHSSTSHSMKATFHGNKKFYIAIDTPKDKQEMVNFKSEVLIVRRNVETPIKPMDNKLYAHTMCTGNKMMEFTGLKVCSKVQYPMGTKLQHLKNLFFLLRGSNEIRIYYNKMDTHTSYIFRASYADSRQTGRKIMYHVAFDTPNSTIDRHIIGKVAYTEESSAKKLFLHLKAGKLWNWKIKALWDAEKQLSVALKQNDKDVLKLMGRWLSTQDQIHYTLELNCPPIMAKRSIQMDLQQFVGLNGSNGSVRFSGIFSTPILMKYEWMQTADKIYLQGSYAAPIGGGGIEINMIEYKSKTKYRMQNLLSAYHRCSKHYKVYSLSLNHVIENNYIYEDTRFYLQKLDVSYGLKNQKSKLTIVGLFEYSNSHVLLDGHIRVDAYHVGRHNIHFRQHSKMQSTREFSTAMKIVYPKMRVDIDTKLKLKLPSSLLSNSEPLIVLATAKNGKLVIGSFTLKCNEKNFIGMIHQCSGEISKHERRLYYMQTELREDVLATGYYTFNVNLMDSSRSIVQLSLISDKQGTFLQNSISGQLKSSIWQSTDSEILINYKLNDLEQLQLQLRLEDKYHIQLYNMDTRLGFEFDNTEKMSKVPMQINLELTFSTNYADSSTKLLLTNKHKRGIYGIEFRHLSDASGSKILYKIGLSNTNELNYQEILTTTKEFNLQLNHGSLNYGVTAKTTFMGLQNVQSLLEITWKEGRSITIDSGYVIENGWAMKAVQLHAQVKTPFRGYEHQKLQLDFSGQLNVLQMKLQYVFGFTKKRFIIDLAVYPKSFADFNVILKIMTSNPRMSYLHCETSVLWKDGELKTATDVQTEPFWGNTSWLLHLWHKPANTELSLGGVINLRIPSHDKIKIEFVHVHEMHEAMTSFSIESGLDGYKNIIYENVLHYDNHDNQVDLTLKGNYRNLDQNKKLVINAKLLLIPYSSAVFSFDVTDGDDQLMRHALNFKQWLDGKELVQKIELLTMLKENWNFKGNCHIAGSATKSVAKWKAKLNEKLLSSGTVAHISDNDKYQLSVHWDMPTLIWMQQAAFNALINFRHFETDFQLQSNLFPETETALTKIFSVTATVELEPKNEPTQQTFSFKLQTIHLNEVSATLVLINNDDLCSIAAKASLNSIQLVKASFVTNKLHGLLTLNFALHPHWITMRSHSFQFRTTLPSMIGKSFFSHFILNGHYVYLIKWNLKQGSGEFQGTVNIVDEVSVNINYELIKQLSLSFTVKNKELLSLVIVNRDNHKEFKAVALIQAMRRIQAVYKYKTGKEFRLEGVIDVWNAKNKVALHLSRDPGPFSAEIELTLSRLINIVAAASAIHTNSMHQYRLDLGWSPSDYYKFLFKISDRTILLDLTTTLNLLSKLSIETDLTSEPSLRDIFSSFGQQQFAVQQLLKMETVIYNKQSTLQQTLQLTNLLSMQFSMHHNCEWFPRTNFHINYYHDLRYSGVNFVDFNVRLANQLNAKFSGYVNGLKKGYLSITSSYVQKKTFWLSYNRITKDQAEIQWIIENHGNRTQFIRMLTTIQRDSLGYINVNSKWNTSWEKFKNVIYRRAWVTENNDSYYDNLLSINGANNYGYRMRPGIFKKDKKSFSLETYKGDQSIAVDASLGENDRYFLKLFNPIDGNTYLLAKLNLDKYSGHFFVHRNVLKFVHKDFGEQDLELEVRSDLSKHNVKLLFKMKAPMIDNIMALLEMQLSRKLLIKVEYGKMQYSLFLQPDKMSFKSSTPIFGIKDVFMNVNRKEDLTQSRLTVNKETNIFQLKCKGCQGDFKKFYLSLTVLPGKFGKLELDGETSEQPKQYLKAFHASWKSLSEAYKAYNTKISFYINDNTAQIKLHVPYYQISLSLNNKFERDYWNSVLLVSKKDNSKKSFELRLRLDSLLKADVLYFLNHVDSQVVYEGSSAFEFTNTSKRLFLRMKINDKSIVDSELAYDYGKRIIVRYENNLNFHVKFNQNDKDMIDGELMFPWKGEKKTIAFEGNPFKEFTINIAKKPIYWSMLPYPKLRFFDGVQFCGELLKSGDSEFWAKINFVEKAHAENKTVHLQMKPNDIQLRVAGEENELINFQLFSNATSAFLFSLKLKNESYGDFEVSTGHKKALVVHLPGFLNFNFTLAQNDHGPNIKFHLKDLRQEYKELLIISELCTTHKNFKLEGVLNRYSMKSITNVTHSEIKIKHLDEDYIEWMLQFNQTVWDLATSLSIKQKFNFNLKLNKQLFLIKYRDIYQRSTSQLKVTSNAFQPDAKYYNVKVFSQLLNVKVVAAKLKLTKDFQDGSIIFEKNMLWPSLKATIQDGTWLLKISNVMLTITTKLDDPLAINVFMADDKVLSLKYEKQNSLLDFMITYENNSMYVGYENSALNLKITSNNTMLIPYNVYFNLDKNEHIYEVAIAINEEDLDNMMKINLQCSQPDYYYNISGKFLLLVGNVIEISSELATADGFALFAMNGAAWKQFAKVDFEMNTLQSLRIHVGSANKNLSFHLLNSRNKKIAELIVTCKNLSSTYAIRLHELSLVEYLAKGIWSNPTFNVSFRIHLENRVLELRYRLPEYKKDNWLRYELKTTKNFTDLYNVYEAQFGDTHRRITVNITRASSNIKVLVEYYLQKTMLSSLSIIVFKQPNGYNGNIVLSKNTLELINGNFSLSAVGKKYDLELAGNYKQQFSINFNSSLDVMMPPIFRMNLQLNDPLRASKNYKLVINPRGGEFVVTGNWKELKQLYLQILQGRQLSLSLRHSMLKHPVVWHLQKNADFKDTQMLIDLQAIDLPTVSFDRNEESMQLQVSMIDEISVAAARGDNGFQRPASYFDLMNMKIGPSMSDINVSMKLNCLLNIFERKANGKSCDLEDKIMFSMTNAFNVVNKPASFSLLFGKNAYAKAMIEKGKQLFEMKTPLPWFRFVSIAKLLKIEQNERRQDTININFIGYEAYNLTGIVELHQDADTFDVNATTNSDTHPNLKGNIGFRTMKHGNAYERKLFLKQSLLFTEPITIASKIIKDQKAAQVTGELVSGEEQHKQSLAFIKYQHGQDDVYRSKLMFYYGNKLLLNYSSTKPLHYYLMINLPDYFHGTQEPIFGTDLNFKDHTYDLEMRPLFGHSNNLVRIQVPNLHSLILTSSLPQMSKLSLNISQTYRTAYVEFQSFGQTHWLKLDAARLSTIELTSSCAYMRSLKLSGNFTNAFNWGVMLGYQNMHSMQLVFSNPTSGRFRLVGQLEMLGELALPIFSPINKALEGSQHFELILALTDPGTVEIFYQSNLLQLSMDYKVTLYYKPIQFKFSLIDKNNGKLLATVAGIWKKNLATLKWQLPFATLSTGSFSLRLLEKEIHLSAQHADSRADVLVMVHSLFNWAIKATVYNVFGYSKLVLINTSSRYESHVIHVQCNLFHGLYGISAHGTKRDKVWNWVIYGNHKHKLFKYTVMMDVKHDEQLLEITNVDGTLLILQLRIKPFIKLAMEMPYYNIRKRAISFTYNRSMLNVSYAYENQPIMSIELNRFKSYTFRFMLLDDHLKSIKPNTYFVFVLWDGFKNSEILYKNPGREHLLHAKFNMTAMKTINSQKIDFFLSFNRINKSLSHEKNGGSYLLVSRLAPPNNAWHSLIYGPIAPINVWLSLESTPKQVKLKYYINVLQLSAHEIAISRNFFIVTIDKTTFFQIKQTHTLADGLRFEGYTSQQIPYIGRNVIKLAVHKWTLMSLYVKSDYLPKLKFFHLILNRTKVNQQDMISFALYHTDKVSIRGSVMKRNAFVTMAAPLQMDLELNTAINNGFRLKWKLGPIATLHIENNLSNKQFSIIWNKSTNLHMHCEKLKKCKLTYRHPLLQRSHNYEWLKNQLTSNEVAYYVKTPWRNFTMILTDPFKDVQTKNVKFHVFEDSMAYATEIQFSTISVNYYQLNVKVTAKNLLNDPIVGQLFINLSKKQANGFLRTSSIPDNSIYLSISQVTLINRSVQTVISLQQPLNNVQLEGSLSLSWNVTSVKLNKPLDLSMRVEANSLAVTNYILEYQQSLQKVKYMLTTTRSENTNDIGYAIALDRKGRGINKFFIGTTNERSMLKVWSGIMNSDSKVASDEPFYDLIAGYHKNNMLEFSVNGNDGLPIVQLQLDVPFKSIIRSLVYVDRQKCMEMLQDVLPNRIHDFVQWDSIITALAAAKAKGSKFLKSYPELERHFHGCRNHVMRMVSEVNRLTKFIKSLLNIDGIRHHIDRLITYSQQILRYLTYMGSNIVFTFYRHLQLPFGHFISSQLLLINQHLNTMAISLNVQPVYEAIRMQIQRCYDAVDRILVPKLIKFVESKWQLISKSLLSFNKQMGYITAPMQQILKNWILNNRHVGKTALALLNNIYNEIIKYAANQAEPLLSKLINLKQYYVHITPKHGSISDNKIGYTVIAKLPYNWLNLGSLVDIESETRVADSSINKPQMQLSFYELGRILPYGMFHRSWPFSIKSVFSSTAMLVSGQHIITFDQLLLNLPDQITNCNGLMLIGFKGLASTGIPAWTLKMSNIPNWVVVLEKVYATKNQRIEIPFDGVARIDDQGVSIPYYDSFNGLYISRHMQAIILHDSKLKLQLRIYLLTGTIQVDINRIFYHHKLYGLFGNADNEPSNDYVNGRSEVAVSISDSNDLMRLVGTNVDRKQCKLPVRYTNDVEEVDKCEFLFRFPLSVLSSCRNILPSHLYENACHRRVHNATIPSEQLCLAMKVYADDCAQYGSKIALPRSCTSAFLKQGHSDSFMNKRNEQKANGNDKTNQKILFLIDRCHRPANKNILVALTQSFDADTRRSSSFAAIDYNSNGYESSILCMNKESISFTSTQLANKISETDLEQYQLFDSCNISDFIRKRINKYEGLLGGLYLAESILFDSNDNKNKDDNTYDYSNDVIKHIIVLPCDRCQPPIDEVTQELVRNYQKQNIHVHVIEDIDSNDSLKDLTNTILVQNKRHRYTVKHPHGLYQRQQTATSQTSCANLVYNTGGYFLQKRATNNAIMQKQMLAIWSEKLRRKS